MIKTLITVFPELDSCEPSIVKRIPVLTHQLARLFAADTVNSRKISQQEGLVAVIAMMGKIDLDDMVVLVEVIKVHLTATVPMMITGRLGIVLMLFSILILMFGFGFFLVFSFRFFMLPG